MANRKHVHKYAYGRIGDYYHGWFCGDACPHFLPGNVAESIYSRQSRCWICDSEFALNSEIIERARLDYVERKNRGERMHPTRYWEPVCTACFFNVPDDDRREWTEAEIDAYIEKMSKKKETE